MSGMPVGTVSIFIMEFILCSGFQLLLFIFF